MTEEKPTALAAVTKTIQDLATKGEVNFPGNYSYENALKSFWLLLKETKDKNKNLALNVCTRESIINAMLDMVLQGLSPNKKQCYAIVYDNKLSLQRSYFGTQAVLKRIFPGAEIRSQVVYKGDKFSMIIDEGITKVSHETSIENRENDIVGAYCVIKLPSGETHTEVMTMDEIITVWRQSKQYPIDEKGNIKEGTVHAKFPAEMAKRSIINRACKSLINSSDDSDLVIQAFNRTTEAEFENDSLAIFEEIKSEQQNSKPLFQEKPKPAPKPKIEPAKIQEAVVVEEQNIEIDEIEMITDSQGKRIYAIMKAIERDGKATIEQLRDELQNLYSVTTDRKLTREQADEWIQHLQMLSQEK